jgi:transposase InsO family protein
MWAGFLYVAMVIDACSRMAVGWSMAVRLRTELILDALDMGQPLGGLLLGRSNARV